jgi:hypothetical protein
MNSALSSISNYFFSTTNDFKRVNKIDFERKLKPVIDALEMLPYQDDLEDIKVKLKSSRHFSAHSFTYPIENSHEIYVRISTLQTLRDYCCGLLDTLPEPQEKALREFLIYVEPQVKHTNNQASDSLPFTSITLKPL